MTYRRRPSPLYAARAAVGLAWCAALGLAALLASGPLELGVVGITVLAAGVAAGVGGELRRGLRFALPLALAVTVINALVTRDGLTVIWRFGDLPVVGQTDVTLEATVVGAVLGLRAAALVLIGLLFSLAVDPDEVLRLLRRWSFASALSATIATRMVPVLLRDSRRLADAQRCRPGRPPGRVVLLRATTSGVLDRALDVAAALEVRGYGAARRGPSPNIRARVPWSRHDLAFAISAVAVVALALGGRVGGLAPFTGYPLLRIGLGAGPLTLCGALMIAVLAPFFDRRGIER
jgi:energy-coupling factor transport system permease protein